MTSDLEIKIPGRAVCLDLMIRFKMPAHVIRHSEVVCALAVHLSQKLNQHGYDLNLDLVRAAGLLHDITKRYSFNLPLNHALTGAKLLKKLGYPQVAEIVGQHVRFSSFRPAGRISEVEIVNYADKRVVNDKITTLAGRLAYLKDRYGRTEQDRIRLEKLMEQTFLLEKQIFKYIPGGPDQLLGLEIEADDRYGPAWNESNRGMFK